MVIIAVKLIATALLLVIVGDCLMSLRGGRPLRGDPNSGTIAMLGVSLGIIYAIWV